MKYIKRFFYIYTNLIGVKLTLIKRENINNLKI